MAILFCGTLGANTGKPQCDVAIGAIKYLLLSRGATFTEAELKDSNTLKAALLAKMLLPKTDTQKVFLIPYANEAEDNTGDPQTASLSDGFEEVLTDALPKYILRHAKVGVRQNQALAQFNGWSDKIFIIDRNNRFVYIQNADFTGKGFTSGNLYYDPPRPGASNAQKVTVGRLTFGSIDEFKTSVVGLVDTSFNPADLVNIEDVDVVQKAAPASNVVTVGLITRFGGSDLYSSYKTPMNNAARWVITNEDTGGTIAITSVATDDPNKGWDITIDSTAFGALASGAKYSINTASPAVLDAAGVKGIEGNKIVYTKP